MYQNKAILIFTDLGFKFGMGHFARTKALADAFIAANWRADFVINSDTNLNLTEPKHKTRYFGDNWITTDFLHAKTPSRFLQKNYDLLILDSYLLTQNFIDDFATYYKNTPCVIFEDAQNLNYPPHYIIHNASLPPQNNDGKINLVMQNSKYILIKSKFLPPKNKEVKSLNNILLIFGGSDYRGLSLPILEFMQKEFNQFNYKLVIGKYAEPSLINATLKLQNARTQVVVDPSTEQLVDIMQKSDLAISAAGQTLYELATCLVPIISIEIVDNQANVNTTWESLGLAKSGGNYQDKNLLVQLNHQIKTLQDKNLRTKMIQNQAKIFDGNGSIRSRDFIIKKFNL